MRQEANSAQRQWNGEVLSLQRSRRPFHCEQRYKHIDPAGERTGEGTTCSRTRKKTTEHSEDRANEPSNSQSGPAVSPPDLLHQGCVPIEQRATMARRV